MFNQQFSRLNSMREGAYSDLVKRLKRSKGIMPMGPIIKQNKIDENIQDMDPTSQQIEKDRYKKIQNSYQHMDEIRRIGLLKGGYYTRNVLLDNSGMFDLPSTNQLLQQLPDKINAREKPTLPPKFSRYQFVVDFAYENQINKYVGNNISMIDMTTNIMYSETRSSLTIEESQIENLLDQIYLFDRVILFQYNLSDSPTLSKIEPLISNDEDTLNVELKQRLENEGKNIPVEDDNLKKSIEKLGEVIKSKSIAVDRLKERVDMMTIPDKEKTVTKDMIDRIDSEVKTTGIITPSEIISEVRKVVNLGYNTDEIASHLATLFTDKTIEEAIKAKKEGVEEGKLTEQYKPPVDKVPVLKDSFPNQSKSPPGSADDYWKKISETMGGKATNSRSAYTFVKNRLIINKEVGDAIHKTYNKYKEDFKVSQLLVADLNKPENKEIIEKYYGEKIDKFEKANIAKIKEEFRKKLGDTVSKEINTFLFKTFGSKTTVFTRKIELVQLKAGDIIKSFKVKDGFNKLLKNNF